MGLPDWLAYQESFFQLAEKVRERSIVPFLGAGMSMEARFPDWNGLTARLLERTHELIRTRIAPGVVPQTIDASDLLFAADFCRRELGDQEFEAEISRLLAVDDEVRERIRTSSNFAALAKLDFPYWLTTNFDRALEAALEIFAQKSARSVDWSQEDEVNKFLLRLPVSVNEPVCVHIHGTVGTANSLIFTERDYQRRYWRSDLDRVKLFVIFTSNSVVTIGFSLSDHDFMSVLREVKAKLALSAPRHFALLSAPRAEIRNRLGAGGQAAVFKEKYGIAPVYFPSDGQDFSHLGQLLEMLNTVVNIEEHGARPAGVSGECPDDPQKGTWGGLPERSGFRVTATVRENPRLHEWFDIELNVERSSAAPFEPRRAVFHLHPTFSPNRYERPFSGNTAQLVLTAYGAFTVGVEVEPAAGAAIPLEIDLAADPRAPAVFRSR